MKCSEMKWNEQYGASVGNNEEKLKREKETENYELVATTTVGGETSKSKGISKKKSYAEVVRVQNELVLASTRDTSLPRMMKLGELNVSRKYM